MTAATKKRSLFIRLTETEYTQIHAMAQRAGMNVSTLVKVALERQATTTGDVVELRKLIRNPRTGRPIGWSMSEQTRRRISEGQKLRHALRRVAPND